MSLDNIISNKVKSNIEQLDLVPQNLPKNIDVFDLHPYEEVSSKKNFYMLTLYELSILLDELINSQQIKKEKLTKIKEIIKPEIKYINIKYIIDKCNQLLKETFNIYNLFMDTFNNYLRDELNHEFKKAVFIPITLENYDFELNENIVNVIIYLKDKIIDIYKKVIQIPSLIPVK